MVEVAKAAVWKPALIVLRRQTTDPWMNAIERRGFVERGSTVRGRQRALQQLRIWAFPGPGQPAGRPVSPCNCTSPKATRITRSPRPSQPPCPTPELFVDRRRGALLHRRAVDFLQALVGDEFRAARRSHTLETTGRCVVHRRVRDERAASAI